MAKVYVMCGLAGSGKSTWIKNNLPADIPVVSRDILRNMLGFTKSAEDKKLLSKENEFIVTQIQDNYIKDLCAKDKDFVVDNQNNRADFRKDLIGLIRQYPNMKIIFVRVNTPLDTCIKRRDGQIPADVMANIYKRFDEPTEDEYDELITVNGIPKEGRERRIHTMINEEICKVLKIRLF